MAPPPACCRQDVRFARVAALGRAHEHRRPVPACRYRGFLRRSFPPVFPESRAAIEKTIAHARSRRASRCRATPGRGVGDARLGQAGHPSLLRPARHGKDERRPYRVSRQDPAQAGPRRSGRARGSRGDRALWRVSREGGHRDAGLRQHRRLCRVGHHGRHLGHRGKLRPSGRRLPPRRRRRHRRRARAARVRAPSSSKTAFSSGRARSSWRGCSSSARP